MHKKELADRYFKLMLSRNLACAQVTKPPDAVEPVPSVPASATATYFILPSTYYILRHAVTYYYLSTTTAARRLRRRLPLPLHTTYHQLRHAVKYYYLPRTTATATTATTTTCYYWAALLNTPTAKHLAYHGATGLHVMHPKF